MNKIKGPGYSKPLILTQYRMFLAGRLSRHLGRDYEATRKLLCADPFIPAKQPELLVLSNNENEPF